MKDGEVLALSIFAGVALAFLIRPKFYPPVKPLLITSGYGYRVDPFDKTKKEFHNGIDVVAPEGTPVKAAITGRAYIFTNEASGNAVIIKGKNGFRVGYAHLSQQVVSNGQTVNKGDLIGYSGSTGHSTGAHLHITLHNPAGAYVNPAKYFSTGRA